MVLDKAKQKEEELKEYYEKNGYKISRAVRIRNLLIKQKRLLGSIKKIVPLKEPVVILHRRSGRVEYHEDASAGRFVFTHSNGQQRYIELRPSDLETHDYYGNYFRAYDVHEDRPFAGWEEPIVDSEQVKKVTDAMNLTREKYEAQLLGKKNRRVWIWFVAPAVALAIGAIGVGLALQFIPQEFKDKIFGGGAKAVVETVQNQTLPPALGAMFIYSKSLLKMQWRKNNDNKEKKI